MPRMSHQAAATLIRGILADDLCGALLDASPLSRRVPSRQRNIDPAAPVTAPRSAKPLSDMIHMLDAAM